MLPEIWDFIVVGGGLAGCVVTSRLHEYNSSLNILLIEAGTDLRNNTIIPYANNTLALSGTALDWQYNSTPQPELGGRQTELSAGKGLGGGTAINYSMSSMHHNSTGSELH
jgi:choline dehydrogenase